jgi:hypothetical protein
MAQFDQLRSAPLSLASLRALKCVKVLLCAACHPCAELTDSFKSLDCKSNVTALDFSHDGSQLIHADENET